MNPKRRLIANQTRRGVLTFEWLLIFSLVIIGIVGGVAAVRSTLIAKYKQVGGSLGALNTSYEVHAASRDYTLKHSTADAPSMKCSSGTIKLVLSAADSESENEGEE